MKKVTYDLYSTSYSIYNKLPKILKQFDLLSFDTETRSLYSPVERQNAKEYLKDANTSDYYYKQARVVSESSGLSYPSLIRTTHFIFGESSNKSHIVICNNEKQELFMWNLVADYKGTFLVHNSLFDLRICHQRTGRLPISFKDTALMAKCLINHVNIWRCKTGLKELVGSYFDSKWSLYNDYEVENLKDKDFLNYCAIDGCAVIYLWEMIQSMLRENNNE